MRTANPATGPTMPLSPPGCKYRPGAAAECPVGGPQLTRPWPYPTVRTPGFDPGARTALYGGQPAPVGAAELGFEENRRARLRTNPWYRRPAAGSGAAPG